MEAARDQHRQRRCELSREERRRSEVDSFTSIRRPLTRQCLLCVASPHRPPLLPPPRPPSQPSWRCCCLCCATHGALGGNRPVEKMLGLHIPRPTRRCWRGGWPTAGRGWLAQPRRKSRTCDTQHLQRVVHHRRQPGAGVCVFSTASNTTRREQKGSGGAH
jgi:hypothetical protein